MLLYLTTNRPSLRDANGNFPPCPHNRICVLAGKSYPHLCWTTEPLAGAGKYVFSVDLPQAEVTKYEYKNAFRDEWLRFFAIPFELLDNVTINRNTYEEMTGGPWDVWELTVFDKRRTATTDINLLGSWACIWLSRESVATARVVHRNDDHMSVEVALTEKFDPDTDYVILEEHSEFMQGGKALKETWNLSTVAGTTPQWVIYPRAWANWAWDEEITRSAVDYIVSHVPGARRLVAYAASRRSKHSRIKAWRDVAVEVGRQLSMAQDEDVDLGLLKSHSQTAVQAMPHRIAQRIGVHLPYHAWNPPRPKPEYVDPERSGRYLLANTFGPYPTKGPGIDHEPQHRPFMSWEERGKKDFNIGQKHPAYPLA